MSTDHGASVLAVMCGPRWLILPETLAALAKTVPPPSALNLAAAPNPHATKPAPKKGGAVLSIPIYGPIVPRASWFSRWLGLTSAAEIASSFKAGLRDPDVTGIMLDIDSPGGAASGIDALAGMIRAARGRKPIKAFIEGTGASAAYWLASAADDVTVSPGSIVGSVGVVATFERNSGRTIEIVSSQSPNKRPDLETDAGRAVVQTVVDALADVFITDVASNRGMTPTSVIERFGRGDVKVGQHAVDAGMADRVGTIDSVVASIRAAEPAIDPLSDAALRARWDADPKLIFKYPNFGIFAALTRANARA